MLDLFPETKKGISMNHHQCTLASEGTCPGDGGLPSFYLFKSVLLIPDISKGYVRDSVV